VDIPSPFGPRHRGQSAAFAETVKITMNNGTKMTLMIFRRLSIFYFPFSEFNRTIIVLFSRAEKMVMLDPSCESGFTQVVETEMAYTDA
jgi:hypothetical protein